ncbi:unnamed protein product [Pocillopora meandrina]|uniref:DNA mismatch repair protein Mlh3 n=1 Tax=Pocillopora meandrina TaxID=46732 RepID=A0AAU9X963_9CNID|nr:unnamed protein product [Pocillopora meandrina]
MIRPLQEEVRSRLRSGVAITNFTQCVEELVLNSLDAEATCITVRIDIPNFKIQVCDNGIGITHGDLRFVGERYSSSKCHVLEDLEQLSFHGFRGEALASIREICDVLEISTRHRSSHQTYCKLFRTSQVLELKESRFPRTIRGTSVTVHGLFSNLPVRRKAIMETLDFDRVRHRIASIALINPKTAFTLINDSSGVKCLRTHDCKSVVSAFSQLFGNQRSKHLQQVQFEQDNFKVSGFISTDTHHSKSLQFLYINRRLILKTRLHKLVNSILAKSEHLKRLPLPEEKDTVRSENHQSKTTSPQNTKIFEKHGIFVLNIDCLVTEYDVCLEPAKTLIEFQNWDKVLSCVEKCIEEFLVEQNLLSNLEDSATSDVSESNEDGPVMKTSRYANLEAFEYKREIETSNVNKSLHSSTVLRPRGVKKVESLLDTSCSENEFPVFSSSDKEIKSTDDKNKTDESEDQITSSRNVVASGSNPVSGLVNTNTLATAADNSSSLLTKEKSFCVSLTGSSFTDSESVHLKKKCCQSGTILLELNDVFPCLVITREAYQSDSNSPKHRGMFVHSTRENNHQSSVASTKGERKTGVLSTFTSPSPIFLNRQCTRKRLLETKEASVDELASPSKNRKVITLKGNCNSRFVLDRRKSMNVKRSDYDAGGAPVNDNCNTKSSAYSSNYFVKETIANDSLDHNAMCSIEVHSAGNKAGVAVVAEETCGSGDSSYLRKHYSDKTTDQICVSKFPTRKDTSAVPGWNPGKTELLPMKDKSSHQSLTSESNMNPDTIEIHTGMLGSSNKDWFCTFDASLGRKLFINSRTGHSSFEAPNEFSIKDDDCSVLSETEFCGKEEDRRQHVPHPCASHVSFLCTPWLPREDRKQEPAKGTEGMGDSHLAFLYKKHLEEQEAEEKLCKWTDAGALQAYEQDLLNNGGKTVTQLLNNWKNPVFAAPEKDILTVNKPGLDKSQISVHNVAHPYRFTKEMLTSMRVLRQLDEKFIVGVVSHEEGADGLLVLVDQHAAHERVRLERLQSELFGDGSDTKTGGKPRIKSSTVSPPLKLCFSQEEIWLLKASQAEIERIGIRFLISQSSESSEDVSVLVDSVPSVFVEREFSEVKRGRPSVAVDNVKGLIREHLEQFSRTRGVPPVIPKAISDVISSQACHGAVKFGEPLGTAECQELIHSLSKCQLPFQCAHGRPSVIPLVDFKFVEKKMNPKASKRTPPTILSYNVV